MTAPNLAVAKPRRSSGGGGGGQYLQTPNPTNPLEHNNRGVELGSKGLWPQAIQEAEIALEGDPENDTFKRNLSGAYLRYGDSLTNKKSFPAAIKQYREGLFVDPENGAAENGLNNCLQHLGKDPRDLAYRQSLAAGAEGHGEFKIAAVEYRICSHIQDSGSNNYKLGRSLIKAGKVVEGYDCLRVALKKDWPKDEQDTLVECHLLLADTLLNFAYTTKKQGNIPTFIKRLNNSMIEYRRAATINPSNMSAVHGLTETAREAVTLAPTFGNLLALGSAYLLQADFDHAKACFEKAWKVNPSSPELAKARLAFHRAVVETPQGLVQPMRVAETVQKVEDLIKLNPKDPDLWYILAKGRQRMGDTAGAMNAVDQSLSLRKYDDSTQKLSVQLRGGGEGAPAGPGGTPGTPGATGATGSTPGSATSGGAIQGGMDPAAAAAAQAKAKEQELSAKNAAVYGNIDGLIKSGQMDAAAKAADDVLNGAPADGQAWYFKGVVMEKKGDLDEAAVCYRQASGLKMKDADDALKRINDMRVKPMIEQADAAIAKNDLNGAGEILKEATGMSPKDAALWRKLADVLKKAGDDKGAERANKKAEDAAKGK